MNSDQDVRMKTLLQQALPRVEGQPEPEHDLWPAVLRKMDARPAPPPLVDWALVAGLVAFVGFFPAAIPVLLYYL
jgi:hypothetical protein